MCFLYILQISLLLSRVFLKKIIMKMKRTCNFVKAVLSFAIISVCFNRLAECNVALMAKMMNRGLDGTTTKIGPIREDLKDYKIVCYYVSEKMKLIE